MSFEPAEPVQTQANQERKPAIAFANVVIVDANGGKHSLGGIPLEAKNALQRTMLKAVESSPDKEFTATVTIRMNNQAEFLDVDL